MKTDSKNTSSPVCEGQRLDSWLWAARLFRTRRLAAEAVTAAHVKLNGQKSKPGRMVKTGDQLEIFRAKQQYVVIVGGFSNQRLPANQVGNLYQELQWSIERRENQQRLRKHSIQGVRYDRSRPSRRDRNKGRQVKQQAPDAS